MLVFPIKLHKTIIFKDMEGNTYFKSALLLYLLG